MTKIYEVRTVLEHEVASRRCDQCGRSDADVESAYVHTLIVDGGYGSKFDLSTLTFELCDRCLAALMLSLQRPPLVERGEDIGQAEIRDAAEKLRVIWAEHTETPIEGVVNRAAQRFDERPIYRASVEARAELEGATKEESDEGTDSVGRLGRPGPGV